MLSIKPNHIKMGAFFTRSTGKSVQLARLAVLSFLVAFSSVSAFAQVNVTGSQTATTLAQKLVGTGVNISNATLNCAANANGVFTVVTSNLGIDSGIVLTSGQAQTIGATAGVNGAQTAFFPSSANGTPGDAQLTALAQNTTFDACILEFDFLPAGDTIKFDYAFGSEEYDSYSCSGFNDVFGFFISGPGFPSATNIALIPGTTIPVSINSTTDPAITLPGSTALCTAMGAGSPFAQYYVDNSSGTTITYYGFTTVLTAITAVTPCTTYHLKIAISDAGDGSLDSGVFLKAGSLTSNAVTVTPVGGGGLSAPVPYCVRGCLPGQFVFSRPLANPTPLTIHYQIAGTAVNGVDYSQIADSVVIPPNQTSTVQFIYGIPVTPPPGGPVSVKLFIFSPYACAAPVVVDSAELQIYDSIQVVVVTPDTAVCKYQTVDLLAVGDTLLTYTWTPTAGLNDPNIPNPSATPTSTTTYTVAATIANSGCPPAHDKVTITIKEEPHVDAGPDRTTCLGTPVQLSLNITPVNQNYVYQWSPGTYLNDPTIANPVTDPQMDITYYIKVDPGAVGCYGYDTINIHVLPNDFFLANKDTAICKGASVQINALGDPAFTYTWDPVDFVSDPNIINPIITPDTSDLYTISATFPGCPVISHQLYIDVQPNPVVFVGPDREKCQWDTIQVYPVISPSYPFYSYTWTPGGPVDDPTARNIVFKGQQTVNPLTLTVKTPAGCSGFDDLVVTVHEGDFATLAPSDTGICPRDSVQLRATGGVFYDYTPGWSLNDSSIANPVAHPVARTNYRLLVTDQFGCFDTLFSDITVHPEAVLELGENVTLYPGESVTMDPKGNALYFQWFPPLGLSASNIANPLAMPDVNTRYFVNAATEWGCTIMDSIDVLVDPETLLDLPNAFTPGSAPNNEVKIIKRGIATLKYFRIFNRWGAEVFSTSNIDEGWNGRLNNTPQPMGVYVYMVEAYTKTGKRFYKQGNITLIR
jgi:gliding motility-associated-like protein